MISRRLRSWEGLLLVFLIVVAGATTSRRVPNFLTVQNQVNLFQLGIEKAIVVLVMTFVIISGEIDLSVASMMGLSAAVAALSLSSAERPMALAIVVALAVGAAFGLINGFFVAVVGLSSLAVTLAGLHRIPRAWRGCSSRTVRSADSLTWFTDLGQHGLIGPLTLSILIFAVLAVIATVVLHFSGFGRLTYVIGNSAQVARFSGVSVARTKIVIFMMSGFIAALAGVLMAARLGAVRASTAEGFELDIITVVLLGGVSIFGGVGSMVGRAAVDLSRAQHSQRPGHRRHHRQHPDRDHRPAADPVRARSESGGARCRSACGGRPTRACAHRQSRMVGSRRSSPAARRLAVSPRPLVAGPCDDDGRRIFADEEEEQVNVHARRVDR